MVEQSSAGRGHAIRRRLFDELERNEIRGLRTEEEFARTPVFTQFFAQPANRRQPYTTGDQKRLRVALRHGERAPERAEDIDRIAFFSAVEPGGARTDDAPDDVNVHMIRLAPKAANAERSP